jgi:hypothetical protein
MTRALLLERITHVPRHGESARQRPAAVAAPLPDRRSLPLAVWAFAALAAVLATVFGIVFARHMHAPAAEVVAAMYLAAAGVAVVPLALLAAPAGRLRSSGAMLPSVALLSAAAATIHFAAIDKQGGDYWPFTVAFAALAVVQLAWALLVLVRPSRPLLAAGALVNAGTVLVWAYSRTAGLPVGPEPGKAESVAFADVVSTVLEVLLVVGVGVLLLRGRRPTAEGRTALTRALLVALLLIPPTALALVSAVGTHLLVPPSD